MTKSLLTALLAMTISAAVAETSTDEATSPEFQGPPIYQVEFIVVRPFDRSDLASEDWSAQRPALASDAAFEGGGEPAQPLARQAGFNWVNSADFDLPSTLKRLENSGEYEVLLHRSWRQRSTPRNNATPYYLSLPFDQNNALQAFEADKPADFDTPADNGFKTATLGNTGFDDGGNELSDKAGLIGTITFSQARYLHLSLDLLMSEHRDNKSSRPASMGNANPPAEALDLFVNNGLRHFHLQETRRVKTQETHYFDHPAFAVLVHIARVGG